MIYNAVSILASGPIFVRVDVCVYVCVCVFVCACSTLQQTATRYYGTALFFTATECVVDRRIESHGIGDEIYQHCNTLQHTATHCDTLRHTATPATICTIERRVEGHGIGDETYHQCNTPQHTATHATHCNKLYRRESWYRWWDLPPLQHAATHCNPLQHSATLCNKLYRKEIVPKTSVSRVMGDEAYHHCNTLQHAATRCNTLQHTATHSNTLQHTATHCNRLYRKAACPGCWYRWWVVQPL